MAAERGIIIIVHTMQLYIVICFNTLHLVWRNTNYLLNKLHLVNIGRSYLNFVYAFCLEARCLLLLLFTHCHLAESPN